VAVHGEVAPGQALLRSGGRPNQLVYVSGSLGDAAAALQFMNKKLSATQQDAGYFMQRYYRPEPRLQVGGVARMVSAAVDVSDGLIADLGHICKRSDIGATIDLERLPLSPALQRSCSEVQALELAATGGDDYELCLLVPETGRSQFEELAAQFGLPVTLIGNTNRHSGVQCLYKGSPHEFTTTGFTHF
ncbi:MAG: thiamine-phosphate kinase, partial [Cellvibrionaceae bacterium]|nr:thiamine-phosphate kinase [Cellvibrionaceae bacterium]